MRQDHIEAIRSSCSSANLTIVSKPNLAMVCGDARHALRAIPDASIDAVITSPPYADAKNYGSNGQVGHGQTINQYFIDMKEILTELLRATKDGGALWLVLDTVKVRGQMMGIPWQISVLAQEAGWVLQDTVVWDKGKSLPWSGHGRFRNVCEHIILLSKGQLKNFNLDSVRDSEHLSSYWVKYPERYHPGGKAPSDLWHFPIPNQGSWSPSQTRHFCPFPVALVARMVNISTMPGDVVLDPFSGTGSVASVSSYLGRFGVGIELNDQFVSEFDETGYQVLYDRCSEEMPQKGVTGQSLHQSIVALRMLKYPKALYAELAREDVLGKEARNAIGCLWLKSACELTSNTNEADDSVDNKVGCIELKVLLNKDADYDTVSAATNTKVRVKPLSLYGLQANIEVVPFDIWTQHKYFELPGREQWYAYRKSVFNIFEEEVSQARLATLIEIDAVNKKLKVPSIYAPICLDIQVPVS